MKYKVLLKILSEKGNCFITTETFRYLDIKQLELDCGFKIRFRPTTNLDENGYVVEKDTKKVVV